METKIFGGKKITIRKMATKDLKIVPRWARYINDLIEEDVFLMLSKKLTHKEEKEWLTQTIKKINKKEAILLVAQSGEKIIGNAEIRLMDGKRSHIGLFGISISKDFRGIGLGSFLMDKIIKLAKKEIKPTPRFILLGAFAENKIAINLYKKKGFKQTACVPNQFMQKGKLMDEIIMELYL